MLTVSSAEMEAGETAPTMNLSFNQKCKEPGCTASRLEIANATAVTNTISHSVKFVDSFAENRIGVSTLEHEVHSTYYVRIVCFC